jgi:uncharacterized protein YidB (DUF937 family)
MSFFDDALKDAVPGGDLATPIAIAAGALLLHHFMGGSSAAPTAAPTPQAASGGFLSGGGLLGGLGGLVSKLEGAGAGPQVNSWVGTGANQPIAPATVGTALGPDVIAQLSARTGMNQQQILDGLAKMLPQFVNNLTPNGRLPTAQEAQYGR